MTDLTTTDDDDLFTPAENPRRETAYGLDDGGHRYKFPPPPGVERPKPWIGWMRTSNLVSAFSDQERLQLWLEWKAFMGLRAADGVLFDEWMALPVEGLDTDTQKAMANFHAEKAREQAHANAAARRGTAQHAVNETYFSTGQVTGSRAMRRRLEQVIEELDRQELDVIETEYRIWHPAAGGVMGTCDTRVSCRRTGRTGPLDWKTQARFWTWQEIAGQVAGVYGEAPWKWQGPADETGGWVPNEPNTLLGTSERLKDQPVALVCHMPASPELDRAPVQIHEVSVEYGRAVVECAAQNVALRSVGRSQAESRRPAALRPSAIVG
jgi:hypothetical protein